MSALNAVIRDNFASDPIASVHHHSIQIV